MSHLTLSAVLPVLAQSISATFALQITDPQDLDYGGHDYGGVVQPEWELAAVGSATAFIISSRSV